MVVATATAETLNGTAGINDIFVFTSAAAANGDTILTFEAGDRVDLTAIDANSGVAGDQSFTLVTGALHRGGRSARGYVRRAGNVTVVQGNIDGNADADFTFEIAGNQNSDQQRTSVSEAPATRREADN